MSATPSLSFRALALLWLAGNGLRLPMLAVPPILALIIVDLKLSGTEVGILNAIPACLFALVSVPGSALIARVGAVPALIIGLLTAAAGSALRGFASTSMTLFAATIVMSAGIAVMQPALPPTVRQWQPQRIGFATAVYTNGLLCGEIFPVVLAAIVLPVLGGNWRASLIVWSIPLALVALAIFVFQPGGKSVAPVRHHLWMPDWRAPELWQVGLTLGGANQLYFCANAFLPGYLLQAGRTDLIGLTLSVLNAAQLPASFILLAMASRWERKRWPLLVATVFGLFGIAGVLSGSGPWIVVGAGLMGFACAVILTLSLALPALLVPPDDVPRMSAGVFTIGYSMAVLTSIIGGIVWDISGNAAFAFAPVAAVSLFVIFFGLRMNFSRHQA
ncbi:MAG: MFS transporter [Afipia sp.]|jgi:CP family cyanate transporter-like MFS transporter|nr:MFS transporter [Afipia sp.]